MYKPRLIFLGTPDFTGDLLEVILKEELAEVLAIYTKKPKPQGRGLKTRTPRLIELAQQFDTPYRTPENIHSEDEIDFVKQTKPDIAFIVAYGKILKPKFFTIPRYGSFNLHYSLLPAYRGASPVQSAILDGCETSGLSLQRIDEGMDTGDIASQISFPLKSMRSDEVFEKCSLEAVSLVRTFLAEAPKSFTHLQEQKHDEASYCGKFDKRSGRLSPGDKVEKMIRKYRAFYPWPGVYFECSAGTFKVLELGEIISDMRNENNVFQQFDKKKLFLVTPKGAVEILKIQKQGKKALTSRDFLNGAQLSFPLTII